MPAITSVTLEADDQNVAQRFTTTAFGLGDRVRVRASSASTSGFRSDPDGFTWEEAVVEAEGDTQVSGVA